MLIHPGIRGDDGDLAAQKIGGQTSSSGGEEVEAEFALLFDFDEGAGADFVAGIISSGLKALELGEGFLLKSELIGLSLGEIGGFDGSGVVFTFRLGLVAAGALLAFGEGCLEHRDLLREFGDQLPVDIFFGHAASIDKRNAAD